MGLLKTIVGVLPFAGGIVQAVESLFGHGDGATKKQAALSGVQSILAAFGSVTGADVSNSTLAADLGKLIDATVAVYNDLGIFTHANKSTTAAGSTAGVK